MARAQRAFQEYAPLRFSPEETERVYRKITVSPSVDVFVLDMRTYRGPNTANLQTSDTNETVYLGIEQRDWLKRELLNSTATWEVIASDMPIGLQVGDGTGPDGLPRWEAIANGDNGPARGRELEIADRLRYIKQNSILNTVWLTADVH